MKNVLYRGFMKVFLLIPFFLILGGLNGCINSNTESNRFDVIKVGRVKLEVRHKPPN